MSDENKNNTSAQTPKAPSSPRRMQELRGLSNPSTAKVADYKDMKIDEKRLEQEEALKTASPNPIYKAPGTVNVAQQEETQEVDNAGTANIAEQQEADEKQAKANTAKTMGIKKTGNLPHRDDDEEKITDGDPIKHIWDQWILRGFTKLANFAEGLGIDFVAGGAHKVADFAKSRSHKRQMDILNKLDEIKSTETYDVKKTCDDFHKEYMDKDHVSDISQEGETIDDRGDANSENAGNLDVNTTKKEENKQSPFTKEQEKALSELASLSTSNDIIAAKMKNKAANQDFSKEKLSKMVDKRRKDIVAECSEMSPKELRKFLKENRKKIIKDRERINTRLMAGKYSEMGKDPKLGDNFGVDFEYVNKDNNEVVNQAPEKQSTNNQETINEQEVTNNRTTKKRSIKEEQAHQLQSDKLLKHTEALVANSIGRHENLVQKRELLQQKRDRVMTQFKKSGQTRQHPSSQKGNDVQIPLRRTGNDGH